jgi:glucose-6-phosphate 1-dehydrogenase
MDDATCDADYSDVLVFAGEASSVDPNDSTNISQEALGGPAGPCTMVIFGAGGDLTKRLLIPSIYNLACGKLLPEQFAIVGVSIEPFSTDQFRDQATKDIHQYATREVEDKEWAWFDKRIYYVSGDFHDDNLYSKLKDTLAQIEKDQGTGGNCLFYLATGPEFFPVVVQHLGAAGLTKQVGDQWKRVVIEKPFGHDLPSAIALNKTILEVLDEKQVFRMDHYLGKETVQNIIAFRFANGIFEPVWNRRYVDHVQVTVAETLGVELRGGYYETAGALRDMVPNHIFQLITLCSMEPPISFEADAVHDEQTKILHAIQPINPQAAQPEAVCGQYGAGAIGGKPVVAYRSEPHVAPDSRTSTFVALALHIDNWRWAGVPFYLRTGKRMAKMATQVVVRFRRPPFIMFRNTSVEKLAPNEIVIDIQPDEGISLNFEAKVPGPVVRLGAVNMKFEYSDYFGNAPQTGYETLIYDCMKGDPTLFQRADMVEASWKIVQPIIDAWKTIPTGDFPNYAAGSWGPEQSFELLRRDGREWRDPTRDDGARRDAGAAAGKR